MPLTITTPAGLVDCDCAGGNRVCVKGTGAKRDNQLANGVWVKIYLPPDGPSPTTQPPTDAVQATRDSDGNWTAGLLGGAACSNGPPYTDCKVWVWAGFTNSSSSSSSSSSGSSSSGTVYEVATSLFQGKCSATTPSC